MGETLPALQECVAAGKVKRIGMTSYDLSLQQMIIEAAHNAGELAGGEHY